jgi:hypothetical protein
MQQSTDYRPPLPRRPQATGASSTPDHCPFLGTAADPSTSLDFPSDAHQCHSTRLQVPISTIHQENYCLSPNYEACPVYRQHPTAAPSGSLLPLTAVAAKANNETDEPPPWASGAALATGAALTGETAFSPAVPLPPPSRSALSWDQPAHPDFTADLAAEAARRRTRRVGGRPVLIGLLLLLLIPLVWWLWTTARPGARGAVDPAGGAVVTLPTLVATAEVPPTDAVVAAVASPTPAAAGGQAEATAETGAATEVAPAATATLTDLEIVAATATALFAAATPATECVAPAWWVAYTVEAGDTLENLAAARGARPEELIVANCLAGPELPVGLVIALPPVGVIVVQPGQATATATRPRVTPTRGALVPPTPIIFPSPTFPVVIILPTGQPTFAPTDEPATRPPTRQPTRPPASPTMTPIVPVATATIPIVFPTTTPPAPGPTQTPPISATQTPPFSGPTATPTATTVSGAATQTPPAP